MKGMVRQYNRASEQAEPQAAVAIIRSLRPVESILLLRRIENSCDPWSGHFAFPGGRREEQDSSLYDTCLREVHEETGIELRSGALQQTLTPTRAGRNVEAPILVQPFLFEIDERPAVSIETREIDSYVWLETAAFSDIRKHISQEVLPNMIRPIFPLDDYYVWGFTYNILCRLLDVDIGSIASEART